MQNHNIKYELSASNGGSETGSGDISESRNLDFKARFKKVREKIGLTQNQLAEKIGASKSTIQSYEAGALPKGDYAIRLSKIFGCTLDWLLMGVETSNYKIDEHQKSVGVNEHTVKDSTQEPGPELDGSKTPELVKKTIEILESNTPYKTALTSNINAFHRALKLELGPGKQPKPATQEEDKEPAFRKFDPPGWEQKKKA